MILAKHERILSDTNQSIKGNRQTSRCDPRLKAERAERIVALADHLPDTDRLVVRAIYADGMTIKQVAGLMSTNPRTVAHRVKRLTDRLLSPEFGFVVLHHNHWEPTLRTIAIACVLHDRSFKDVAAELHTSVHAVRVAIATVRGMRLGTAQLTPSFREREPWQAPRRVAHTAHTL